MSLLELDEVHSYYGNIHALKGISLTVDKGEIVRVARGRYSPCTETSACPGAGDHNNHNGHNDHEKRLATEREIAEREEFERQAMNAPDPEVTSNAAETMRFLHDAFEQTLSRMSAVRRSGGAAS